MKQYKYYHHVDNGGPTVNIQIPENRKELEQDGYCFLELTEHYYDYSGLSWKFFNPPPKMLRAWAYLMLDAAKTIEEQTDEQFKD